MFNIIFGLIAIVGGLSGKLALIGTNSGYALAAFGVFQVLWGISQVRKNRQNLGDWRHMDSGSNCAPSRLAPSLPFGPVPPVRSRAFRMAKGAKGNSC